MPTGSPVRVRYSRPCFVVAGAMPASVIAVWATMLADYGLPPVSDPLTLVFYVVLVLTVLAPGGIFLALFLGWEPLLEATRWEVQYSIPWRRWSGHRSVYLHPGDRLEFSHDALVVRRRGGCLEWLDVPVAFAHGRDWRWFRDWVGATWPEGAAGLSGGGY